MGTSLDLYGVVTFYTTKRIRVGMGHIRCIILMKSRNTIEKQLYKAYPRWLPGYFYWHIHNFNLKSVAKRNLHLLKFKSLVNKMNKQFRTISQCSQQCSQWQVWSPKQYNCTRYFDGAFGSFSPFRLEKGIIRLLKWPERYCWCLFEHYLLTRRALLPSV